MTALQINTKTTKHAANQFGQHHDGALEIEKTMNACYSMSALADAVTGASVARDLAALAAAIKAVLVDASTSTNDADLKDSVGPLAALVDGWKPPPGLSTNAITVAHDELIPDLLPGTYYVDASGEPLYPNTEPDQKDFHQGGLGDCWALATLAAAAKQNPDLIKSLITDNGDGTYTVHFKDGDVEVHDNALSVSNHSSAKWLRIIERAYAEYAGGDYDDIVGDQAGRAIDDLFDMASSKFDPNSDGLLGAARLTAELLYIAQALSTQKIVTAEISNHNVLSGAHELTVVGFVVRDGKRYVQLFNPWGQNGGDFGDNLRNHFGAKLEDPSKGYVLVPEDQVGDLISGITISE